MNAINKVGRPIIPSQSGDESFSSGRARVRKGGVRAKEGAEEGQGETETRGEEGNAGSL